MQSTKFSSGQFAKLAGINRETVRFYERAGLLSKPERSSGGFRIYSDADVRRLKFILRSKDLGFSLAEVAELLAIADGRLVRCKDVKQVANQRLEQIEVQLRTLEKLRTCLRSLVKQCDQSRSVNGCPIIDSLSG